ncbi:hypothetical protein [Cytobacillus gottheilii]|uniref:hypothetical protein n=1 Tax=Cytobacillus gottheilii TaxID=859144 RepID=UPI0009BA787C|nr:hypothetical protein [Cytobacillus gottheilii]
MTNEKSNLLIQMECMLFFEENQYAMETVSSISMRIGRRPEDIALVLNQLTVLNVVDVFGEGDSAIYCYRIPDVQSDVIIK